MSRPRRRKKRPDDRAVAYVRASTSKQTLTPAAQQRVLEAYCEEKGLTLCAVATDEAVSGAVEFERRPGWVFLMQELAKHDAGLVLVVTRSRIARDVYLSSLADRLVDREGARIVDLETAHLGSGTAATMTRDMLNAFAANERRVISDRTKRVLDDLRGQKKKWNSTPRYGYRFENGVEVEVPDEQKALKDLRRWRKRGLSITRCTELLEEKGHQPRGAKWHRTTVSRLAQRVVKEDDA